MNLNFVGTFKQPWTGANWWFAILIGAGLTLASTLLVQAGVLGAIVQLLVFIATAGYSVRLMENVVRAANNDPVALPEWTEDPKTLLSRGFFMGLGVFVWSVIIGAVVLALAFAVGIGPVAIAALANGNAQAIAAGALLIFFGVAMIGMIFVMPLLSILMVHYAVENRFGAFFELRAALRVMFARPLSTLVALIVEFAILFVAGIFGGLPLIGVIVGAVASFAASVMIANLWAQVYRNAR